MPEPSAAVAAAIARRQGQAQVSETTLSNIREKAKEVRDAEARIAMLEEQLAQTKLHLNEVRFKQLPDLMMAAGVETLTVAAEGNFPAFTAELKPYYYARIPKDESKRIAAFNMLEESGNGDLIETVVTLDFPREARAEVAAFLATLPRGIKHEVKADVRWNVLEKWLRETVEAGHMPDLSLFSGVVGKQVKLKEKK